ncbi:MAG: Lrp/AsnC family transcriptional regulator, partial [Rhodobacteraceae bacterium]|nr:Lrp/AsnC family transcriptional regulator [Paracoccaceae bacterium]
AERAATTPSVASRRLSRMRSDETIVSKTVLIDWAALGYEVEVSLRVTLDKTQPRAFDAFIDAARDVPEVIEIQTFLGRVDVRLSVVARDMADYQQVYRDRILTLPHIAEVEALMHVARIKTNAGVPI